MKASCHYQWLLVGLFSFFFTCFAARANVYATDIRLNGSLQAGVLLPSNSPTISYILNDTATNVTVQIRAGDTLVKTFSSTNGTAGTNIGLNTLVWSGTNDNGFFAADGVYAVSITASAAGYDTWTNITDDGTNFQVFDPTGIAVNRNTNSPYYGRVFIGNCEDGNGMADGIVKCNADGSPAEEGGLGTGGYPWGGGGITEPSPWKMAVGADDRLYVDDWSQNGVVVSFDQVISTNYLMVLGPVNYPPWESGISLSGPCVCGEGTNMQIFMADFNPDSQLSSGILSWTLSADGVISTNDTGTVDVTLANNSDLALSPYAVSVDTNGNIYTIQQVELTNDPNFRLLCFPPTPSGGPPDTEAIWKIGSGDPTQVNNSGVAVDPTATYVAVATRGYDDGNGSLYLQQGGVGIFLAASGDLVTNITQDTQGDTNLEYLDVAWDNVGNLYAVYAADGFAVEGWRVYSAPGSNSATTVAVPFIQVYHQLAAPQLSQPSWCMGQLNFTLTGQSNVTYIIQQSPDLLNWTPVATNSSPTTVSAISVDPPDNQDFYRAVASP